LGRLNAGWRIEENFCAILIEQITTMLPVHGIPGQPAPVVPSVAPGIVGQCANRAAGFNKFLGVCRWRCGVQTGRFKEVLVVVECHRAGAHQQTKKLAFVDGEFPGKVDKIIFVNAKRIDGFINVIKILG
jgi:hypothetical protein